MSAVASGQQGFGLAEAEVGAEAELVQRGHDVLLQAEAGASV